MGADGLKPFLDPGAGAERPLACGLVEPPLVDPRDLVGDCRGLVGVARAEAQLHDVAEAEAADMDVLHEGGRYAVADRGIGLLGPGSWQQEAGEAGERMAARRELRVVGQIERVDNVERHPARGDQADLGLEEVRQHRSRDDDRLVAKEAEPAGLDDELRLALEGGLAQQHVAGGDRREGDGERQDQPPVRRDRVDFERARFGRRGVIDRVGPRLGRDRAVLQGQLRGYPAAGGARTASSDRR